MSLFRPTAFAAVLAGLLPAALPSIALAQAARDSRDYAIPAGQLDETLRRIARESSRLLVVDPALVRGRSAPAIQGHMDPESAIRAALSGSGLTLEVTADGGLAVRSAVAESSPSSGPTQTLPSVQVTSTIPPYMADRPSSSATKTELPPRQIPFSIDQASEELIQERGDSNIYATLEGFAGLTTNSSNSDAGGGHSRAIQIRGFSAGQTLVNGIPSYSDTAGTLRSTDSLESIELLRGPAGLYYGSAEPGGVISYNYKRPQAQRRTVLRGELDDHGSFGGMIDTTGAVDESGRLLYRFVGSAKRREDDQDHIWSEPKSLLAAVTVRPNREFQSTLTYERSDVESVPEQENNFRITSGPLAGQYYPVPRDFFWGSRNDRVERKTNTVLWDATWSRNERLKVRAGVIYQDYTQWWQNTRATDTARGPSAAGLVQRYVSGRQSEGDSATGSLDFSGTLRAGGWRHDWLAGLGAGRSSGSSSGRAVATQSRDNGPYPVGPIDIDAPVYLDYPYRFAIWEDPLVPSARREDRNLYLQDIVHLPGSRIRLMLGAGWSQYRSTPQTGPETKVQRWSPRLAIMQDLSETAMVYASYGESFLPQSGLTLLDTGGRYITDPVEGVQYELGMKQDLFDGAAMLTAALFRVDKKNEALPIDGFACTPGGGAVPVIEPPDGSDVCYALAGLTRAQGLELRLTGQITERWVAQIGYSYTRAKYLRHETAAYVGRTVEYTPRHNLSVWNRFNVYQNDRIGRFNLGLGVRAWSEVHGTWSGNASDATANVNPGYGLVDLGLTWDRRLSGQRDLRVALNVSNLFDKTYYERRRFPPGTVLYGDERRITMTVQLAF
ncbi:MAG: TonB-dependent siderophore receptor [Lautropia sp.]